MTTIPSRLAQVTRASSNIVQAKARGRTLYREWFRNVRALLHRRRPLLPPEYAVLN